MPPQFATRKLGKSGPNISALGFGLMGLSMGSINDKDRFAILDKAYEIGARFWDSADVYGDNEELIGKWFKRTGKRDEIFLATKFGNVVHMENGQRTYGCNSSPSYVKEACTKSLECLGIDCIDLYYCHRCDLQTPIEKTVEAMVELKNSGKIKYLGLSEISSTTLRRACAIHHIDAVQIEYSPFSTDIEDPTIALLATCRELGVAIIPYSPLGRGFLTGAYKSRDDLEANDSRRHFPRFSEENFSKNLRLVSQLQEVARGKGCKVGQLCLAWLMAQGEDVIPIPGTKKIKNLEENIKSMDVILSDDELTHIKKIIDAAEVHGERYPAAFSANLFADTPELEE